jgi:hypothetical protein
MGDLVPSFQFSSGGIWIEVLGLGRRRTSHSHSRFAADGLPEDEVALGGAPNCCARFSGWSRQVVWSSGRVTSDGIES